MPKSNAWGGLCTCINFLQNWEVVHPARMTPWGEARVSCFFYESDSLHERGPAAALVMESRHLRKEENFDVTLRSIMLFDETRLGTRP